MSMPNIGHRPLATKIMCVWEVINLDAEDPMPR